MENQKQKNTETLEAVHTYVLVNGEKNSSVQKNGKGIKFQNIKYVENLKNVEETKKFEREKNWYSQKAGITLIALVITTIFSYDENVKSSNNKGFLLQTI